jgi:hypothetical protein
VSRRLQHGRVAVVRGHRGHASVLLVLAQPSHVVGPADARLDDGDDLHVGDEDDADRDDVLDEHEKSCEDEPRGGVGTNFGADLTHDQLGVREVKVVQAVEEESWENCQE